MNFFHPENWYAAHYWIALALKLSGLYWRGRRNAEKVRLRRNVIVSAALPPNFEGYTILHLSDLHVDTNPAAMQRVIALIRQAGYMPPIYLHGALASISRYYQSRGITLGEVRPAREADKAALDKIAPGMAPA